MMEEDFFNEFYKNLQELNNDKFIFELKRLIENKQLSQSRYKKLIRDHFK